MFLKKGLDKLLISSTTPTFKKISNIHKGDTCYFFGDGPSISWFDLSQFSDYVGICCGCIPFHKDFNNLNIRYILSVGAYKFVPNLFKNPVQLKFNSLTNEYKKFMIKHPEKTFFINISNYFSVSGRNIYYVHRTLPKSRNNEEEVLRGYNLFSGAFYSMLTIAYYMGFSKIYLIGFDAWTHNPLRNGRWYEKGKGEYYNPIIESDPVFEFFKDKMEICTITLNDSSINTKAISYERFTGLKPQFKENYNLMKPIHLKALSTIPNLTDKMGKPHYTIY